MMRTYICLKVLRQKYEKLPAPFWGNYDRLTQRPRMFMRKLHFQYTACNRHWQSIELRVSTNRIESRWLCAFLVYRCNRAKGKILTTHTPHTHNTHRTFLQNTYISLSLHWREGGRGEGGARLITVTDLKDFPYKKHNIQKQAKYIDKTTRKTSRFLGKFVVDLQQTCRAYLPLNIRL